ncbi:MAG TPA: hypothetical protein VL092_00795 [Chitinophagaceae bacterium]|nr:hypothetical protein [Chitinophagaceae bacterium]
MKYWLALVCSISVLSAGAQNNDLIRKLRAANQKPDMAYDYKIVLYDAIQKKKVDSAVGRLAVVNGAYLDSNNYTCTARVGDYFCSLDHAKKTATICNMKILAKKMGTRLENNEAKTLYNISDSLLLNEGNMTIDSSDTRMYRVSIRLKNNALSYAQMDFWRNGCKLAAVHLETVYKSPGEHRITSVTIRNIKHQPGEACLDVSKIYSLSNGKAVLSPKYTHYKLIPVH